MAAIRLRQDTPRSCRRQPSSSRQEKDDIFFAFVPDLLDHLRYTFSPDSRVTYDELFDRIKQAPLLIHGRLGSREFHGLGQ